MEHLTNSNIIYLLLHYLNVQEDAHKYSIPRDLERQHKNVVFELWHSVRAANIN